MRRDIRFFGILGVAGALCASTAVCGQPGGGLQGPFGRAGVPPTGIHSYDRDRVRIPEAGVHRDEDGGRFSDRERDEIRRFYREGDDRDDSPGGSRGKGGGKGKGKGGRRFLPPGLRKKLERGGDLPPGWEKKVSRGCILEDDTRRHSTRIPRDLEIRLPRQPVNSEILEIQNKIIRVVQATGEILDVLDLPIAEK